MELILAIILISALFGFCATVTIFVLIAKADKHDADEDEIWGGVRNNLK